MKKADIGLIGLAVMGQNLVLNMNDKGFSVAVFNRTVEKVDDFIRMSCTERPGIIGAHDVKELVSRLAKPAIVMLMVKAGTSVDETIGHLVPHLVKGDCIIDGGNSFFKDTIRRTQELARKGILFAGVGVSGGEEGARRGPSIMAGGAPEAWPLVKRIMQSIAAKTSDGFPCCDWIGDDGAGHFVKMVHNGIEYGDMQIICEAYQLLKDTLSLSYEELGRVFAEYNKGELDSYLIEITAHIMLKKDADGTPLVERVLDAAEQKGTGKWTSTTSLDLGVPVTLIMEAVNARFLSSMRDERVDAHKVYPRPGKEYQGNGVECVEHVRKALLASKVISYAQGFMLMKEGARVYGWKLSPGNIALIWREGCIIRSVFLEKIKTAYDRNPDLANLLLDGYFSAIVRECAGSLRTIVALGAMKGIPLPALSSALAFYDGYTSDRLPASLLQAQRDYFGSHTYERTDRPRGEYFHTEWSSGK